jgi:hypothetical protein
MGKALAEISTGGEEKAKELKKLGLDAFELQAQGTFEALRTVAKAYTEAADPVKKLAIAYAVFSKSATEVIPVLEKIAELNGQIGGKFAGMGPMQILKAEEVEKNLTRIENAWKNFKNRVILDIDDIATGVAASFPLHPGRNQNFDKWVAEGAAKRAERQAKIDAELFQQKWVDVVPKQVEDQKLAEQGAKAAKDLATELGAKLATFGGDSGLASVELLGRRFGLDDKTLAPLKLKATQLRDLSKDLEKAFDAPSGMLGMQDDYIAKLKRINDLLLGNVELEGARKNALAKAREEMEKQSAQKIGELFKETRHPLEKFQARQSDLAFLGAKGNLLERAQKKHALEMGQFVRDKALQALPGLTLTSPTLRRGSAEEGSFRAQFEQRREGMQTFDKKMLDLFEQALKTEKEQEKKLEKIGKVLQDRLPGFVKMAMGQ